MQSELQKYLNCFKRLKRGNAKYGKAPHKPVMLICVLQAVRNKQITQNQIFITPELVVLFKSNWSVLVTTQHVYNFALPFWHLRGEKIWHLIPKPGFEATIKLKESVSSLGELNAVIEFVKLDDGLDTLLNVLLNPSRIANAPIPFNPKFFYD